MQPTEICHVTVWDRVWLNDRRVTNLTCGSLSLYLANKKDAASFVTQAPTVNQVIQQEAVTASPHITDGRVDDMSAEIEAYTDFALAVIEEQSNAAEKLKVMKILASSVQIVQGKNIRLTLEVASTDCKKDQPPTDNCVIDKTKEIQICNIQIWDKAWLQEKQVTDLNCQPKRVKSSNRDPKSEDFDESPFVGHTPQTFRLGGEIELVPKASRFVAKDTQRSLPLLGGYTNVDPSDSAIVEMANFATTTISQSLNSETNNSSPYSLTKIHSAAKQIVAGVNYKLELELSRRNESLLCSVIILEQSWLSLRQVTNLTCFPQTFSANVQTRKAKNAFGSFKPVEVNDAIVKQASKFAVSAMSKSSPNDSLSLEKVINAARQVLGKQTNYKLTMKLTKNQATVICDAVVAEKASLRLVKSSCRERNNGRRQLAGGYTQADTNDPTIREMADFATLTISKANNAGNLSLLKIVRAETQIVSGKNYKLTLQVKDDTGTQTCDVIVYDQSWTQTRKVTNFSCKDSSGSRVSRQVQVKTRRPPRPGLAVRPTNSELSIQPPSHCIGGYCPVDPDEKSVKEMANFATTMLTRSMNSGPLQLAKVRFAERQVVAGFNYKLDLELDSNKGKVFCKVVIFDQAWTSTRELSQMQCEVAISPQPVASQPSRPVQPTSLQSTNSTLPQTVPFDGPASGAYVTIDTDSPDVKEMANFAVSAIGQSSNGEPLALVEVTSAASQVVAGVNYKLSIQVSSASEVLNCDVIIFDQSWTNTRQLTSSNCIPVSHLLPPAPPGTDDAILAVEARQIGSYFSINPTEKEVVEVAIFAKNLLSMSTNSGDLVLVDIPSASKQVKGGSNFKLTLKLSAVEGGILVCDVVVYNNEKARQLLYSSCAPSTRRKRMVDQMTGGITPMDTKSKKIQEVTVIFD